MQCLRISLPDLTATQAIDHHLLELRRQRAEKRGKKLRKKLQEKNLTENKILKDFEIFRENLRQGNMAHA